MDTTARGVTMFTQAVQHSCAQIQYEYGSDTLPEESQSFMAQVLAYACVFVLDLLPDCEATRASVISWLQSYKGHMDVLDFGKYLKSFDEQLKLYVTTAFNQSTKGTFPWSYERFKRSVSFGDRHMRHLAIVKEPLCRVLADCDPHSFAVVNSWVNFLRRCNLPGLDLEQSCEADYVAFEAEMQSWSYDPDIIKAINRIVVRWFDDFTLDEFLPKHGPGSVAGHEGALPRFLKYEDCRRSDVRLDYIKKDIGPLEEWLPWGSSNFSDVPYCQKRRGNSLPLVRQSELVCVPKSIITNRTISREPAVLQFFQQGYRAAIYSYCHNHPYLKNHIDFEDQEKSRQDAYEGSIFGELATVDLSSASDSVSTELVKGVFKGTGALLRGLLCTRSDSTVLPSGRVLPLKKFAPMGSAVCFPIETIVFSACCEYAKERLAEERFQEILDSNPKAKPRLSTLAGDIQWRVYGDDIIISAEAVEYLLEVLEKLHFKVNATKSFWRQGVLGNFREACGIECLDGTDVTPLRVPRFFRGISKEMMSEADAVTAACSLANNAFEWGAMHLRRLILADMGDIIHKLPWSTDGFIGLETYEYACTNYGCKSRIRYTVPARSNEVCYQRIERYVMTASSQRDCKLCQKYQRGFPDIAKCPGGKCAILEASRKSATTHTRRQSRGKSSGLTDLRQQVVLIGDPETNELLAAYELSRYHEWLLSHANEKEVHRLGQDPMYYSRFSDQELREPVMSKYEADEPSTLCPMRSGLKERWVYDPMGK